MDISLLQGTVASLKLAGDIAKGFLQLKSISDVQAKVIELQSVILSAQGDALAAQAQQTAMLEEIRNLKEEITCVKAWEKEKQRYKLISPWQGLLLYALKENCSFSEPPHWICTNCYENGRKSILNLMRKQNVVAFILFCPACRAEYLTRSATSPPVAEYATE
jgi:hypothetical protein